VGAAGVMDMNAERVCISLGIPERGVLDGSLGSEALSNGNLSWVYFTRH